ncbi:MAG: SMP-30/gluconolactonase/LRE family protein [Marmoricola sp.]
MSRPVEIAPESCEPVVHAHATCGESPMWSPAEQLLWWTDNVEQRIHRSDPATGRDEELETGEDVMDIVLREEGGLALALRKSFATYDADGGGPEVFAEVEQDRPRNRFNDGKADRRGRFWAGSMDDQEWRNSSGLLWRLGADRRPERVLDDVVCANGLGWSPDDRTFYLGESFRYTIFAHDFDAETGTLSNRRVFAEVDDGGFPDGLTVDADGGVWSVHNAAGRVVRYAPDGRVTHVVSMPVPHPTSCIFGGPDLDTLLVTTARQGMDEDELARYPLSGSVFAVHPGTTGLPEPSYAG